MNNEKIKFKIDEKSLFCGVYNDYIKGQTATVSTPLNQNSDESKWRNDILSLKESNCRYEGKIPDMLIRQCTLHSKATCEITDLFVFDKLLLDGNELNAGCQYAMYIKKEVDKIKRHGGILRDNIHFGRLKLHYPISLKYKADGFNIDNKKVLEEIMKANGGFAFVVRGFEYNQNEKTLNIITSLIGTENVLLSTVFRRKKGVGKKLMIDPEKVLNKDYVYIAEEQQDYMIDTSLEKRNKTSKENGNLGEEKVFELLSKELSTENELYHTSKDYPFSPYDIEYIKDGKKQYVEVKSTQGEKGIFNMSEGEIKFMEQYKDYYTLYLVTNVKDEFPKITKYVYNEIIKMKKSITSIRFYA